MVPPPTVRAGLHRRSRQRRRVGDRVSSVTSAPAVVVSVGCTGLIVKHSDVVPPSATDFDGSLDAGTPTSESPEYSARQQYRPADVSVAASE